MKKVFCLAMRPFGSSPHLVRWTLSNGLHGVWDTRKPILAAVCDQRFGLDAEELAAIQRGPFTEAMVIEEQKGRLVALLARWACDSARRGEGPVAWLDRAGLRLMGAAY